MAAASVGLSMTLISIAKLLLFLFAVGFLLFGTRNSNFDRASLPKASIAIVMAALTAFSASLLWTVAPPEQAFGSFAKYGKLLVILVLVLLVRSRSEALCALAAFGLGQLVLVLGSWMLFLHWPVPWATSKMATTEYAVFSSYLDQGIMGAVFAALCWHLRHLVPGRFGSQVAIVAAVLAMSNVLFVLSGRSGHVVAIGLLSLAIMWELPRKYRALVVLLPFVLVTVLFFSSSKVHKRLTAVNNEVTSYSSTQPSVTSSGIRLELWRSAVQLIRERPLAGSGVGSWSTEFNRIGRIASPTHVDIPGNGNPHQEYLQWGVQLGVSGMLLFVGLLLALLRDSLRFDAPAARAAQSALAALSVACLFNSSLYDALIGDFFCVTLGLIFALGAYPTSLQPNAHSTGSGAAA